MHSFTISWLAMASMPLSMAVAKSLPRSSSCGVVGYDNQTDAYFYDASGNYAGYSKCSDHCSKDSKCQSFGYDATSVCMHFNVPVTGNVVQDKSSPDIYYDRGCITTSTPASTPVSTSTAGTTKTVKTTKSTTRDSTVTTSTKSAGPTTLSTFTTTVVATSSATSSSLFANLNSQHSTTSTSIKSSSSSSTTKSIVTSSSPSKTTASSTSTNKATTTSSMTTSAFTTSSSTSKTTTTSSSSRSTSSTVTIPSGCNAPSEYTITSFSWFNSTHNLDCATGPDLGDGTGCIKSDPNGATVWCNPQTDNSCTTCGINVCSTGLPPQPLGYGPPDNVKFTFANGPTCQQLNPATVHRYEVGDGFVNCGGSANFLNFYGSSNGASSVGRVEINGYNVECADGQTLTPYYHADFDIQCTRDAGRNATCTTPGSVRVSLVRFTKA